MPTLLDDITETHEGPEPRVLTEDVRVILRRIIRPGDEDAGASVAMVAGKAKCSPRTVYRVLNPKDSKETIGLDLADRLCLAADSHIAHCRLAWPDGRISDYVSD